MATAGRRGSLHTLDVRATRQYTLNETVAEQLRKLPPVHTRAFWDYLREANQGSQRYVASEVLVMAVRYFVRHGNQEERDQAAELLVLRTKPLILRYARAVDRWRHSPESSDFLQKVSVTLWQHILDPQREFWEANFQEALRRIVISAARGAGSARDNRQQHEERFNSTNSQGGDRAWEPVDSAPTPDAQVLASVESAKLRDALLRLPYQEQQVLILLFEERLKITSQDSSEKTVCSVLGVTDRTVRNIRSRVLRRLRQLLGPQEEYSR